MPAFMSRAPGPDATPSATVKGRRARVPRGHTVSKCPMTTTSGGPPPDQCRWAPSLAGGRPSESSNSAETAAAHFAKPSASDEGDSISTRAPRVSTIGA